MIFLLKDNHVHLPEDASLSKGGFTTTILASLKSISQVIFIENVVSGVLILIAITIASYELGIITLCSSLIGTVVGKIGRANEKSVCTGLYGYNSVLTGIALMLFLTGPTRWVIALAGAVIAAIFSAAMVHYYEKYSPSDSYFSFYHLDLVYASRFLSIRSIPIK